MGLRCLRVPRSCGVQGLRDGVTCLMSGLCSSPVRDRNEDYPSYWWDWLRAFAMGSPVSGRGCVLQLPIVKKAVPPSGEIGSGPSRWGHPSQGQVCVGASHFARNDGLAYTCAQVPPLLLSLRASLYRPDQRETIAMGECYILCGRSGVPGPLGRCIVSGASRSGCSVKEGSSVSVSFWLRMPWSRGC